MKSTAATQSDKTIEITMTISWKNIQEEYTKTVDELVKNVEVKGFRKGKAPRNLAEKELDKNRVYEEVIKHLVPKVYSDAIKELSLHPIMTPDISLSKAKEGEDWEIKAYTCELPKINAENYKDIVQKAKGELKKDDLWLPGKEEKDNDKDKEARRQKQLSTILEALIKNIDIVIPGILVKNEVDQRLTTLLDDMKKLGLTIDSYAKSKNMSPDQIRVGIEKEVVNTYKLEFILEYIADKESITVDDKAIDAVIQKAESPEERKSLEQNRYYLANMLRRQNTLDRLMSL